MTKEQLETLVGLLSGMQTAIVHLSNIVAKQSNIPLDDLANSFVQVGENIPLDVPNRHLIQLALKQVASGIQSSSGNGGWSDELSRLLH